MTKKLSFCILILLTGLASCIVEEETIVEVKLKNNTNHQIELLFYTQGVVAIEKTQLLNPNNEFLMERERSRGKNQPLYWGHYFQSIDSVQIWWDNTYCVTHMISGDYTSGGKFIRYGDIRNLTHPDLFSTSKTKETRSTIKWLMQYDFTEADYEFAKD